MSTPTGRRATQRRAAPRGGRAVQRWVAVAVAADAGLVVAALVAFPVPAGEPAPVAAATSSSAAALQLSGGLPDPAVIQPSAAAEAVAVGSTTAAPVASAAVAPVAVAAQSSALTGSGIPAVALAAYHRAAAAAPRRCGIDWSLLAAIGRVESNHGRFGGAGLGADGRSSPPVLGPVLDGSSTALIPDTDGGRLDGNSTYDRAVGPMQFIPSTWARYGVDADGDGVADPSDINDAAAAAARYLCVAGGDLSTPAGQARAVLAYNHSDRYVAMVLTLGAAYAGGRVPTLPGPAPLPMPTIEPVNPAPPPALEPVKPPAAPVTPSATDAPVVLADGPAPLSPATTTDSTTSGTSTSATTTSATTTSATTTSATTPSATTSGTTTSATTTSATTTSGTTTSGTTTSGTTTSGTAGTTTSGTTTSGTTTSGTAGTTTSGTTTSGTAGTTTSGTTTSGTTTSGTAGTTTSGTTTSGTTTSGTAGTTTSGTTTSGTTTSGTAGTTTSGTTTSGTTTSATTPTTSCPALPRLTVDVVNGTSDPRVAEDVTARLQSAGLAIGSVTSGTGETASSLRYPATAATPAAQLARALGVTGVLHQAEVDHVTLVLAGSSADALRAAVDRVSCPA